MSCANSVVTTGNWLILRIVRMALSLTSNRNLLHWSLDGSNQRKKSVELDLEFIPCCPLAWLLGLLL